MICLEVILFIVGYAYINLHTIIYSFVGSSFWLHLVGEIDRYVYVDIKKKIVD